MLINGTMKLTGKRVLVTGGAGFIGSHLVDRIIEENPSSLSVVDNFFLGKEENLRDAIKNFPSLKIFRLDASDLAAMHDVAKKEKVDAVFNLAIVPLPMSLNYPAFTMKTNIDIAIAMCELLRWGDIETLVHCSSSEAYGTAQYVSMSEKHALIPITPYAASKAGADQIVLSYFRTFDLDAVIVRPFNNYGPRQNPGTYAGIIPIVIQRVHKNLPIEIHGDGQQTRDFIYVRDTTDAFIRVYEESSTRGEVLNIATGEEISINHLVESLLQVMGKPNYPVVHVPPRPGDVRRHRGDIQLARKLIDFNPPVMAEESLKETVSWYEEIGL